jgi:hypothetical protein
MLFIDRYSLFIWRIRQGIVSSNMRGRITCALDLFYNFLIYVISLFLLFRLDILAMQRPGVWFKTFRYRKK